MEIDPGLRSTVIAVTWLDRSLDWVTLTAKVDHASRVIPLFRRRVLEVPARMAAPRWAIDADFEPPTPVAVHPDRGPR
jgi:hypothetical protein